MGEAGGLVLEDVGDLGAEGGAVAGRLADLVAGLRRDDDPDLGDAGVDQRLDPVEEHGFVGHRHQLLRRGVGDRAQPGAGAAREDQSLQVLHWREAIVPHPVSASRSVAVVIPNWNSLEHLERCLGSLGSGGRGTGDRAARGRQRLRATAPSSTWSARASPTSPCPGTPASPPPSTSAPARTEADAILVLNADTVLEPGASGRCSTRSRPTRRSAASSRCILQLDRAGAGGDTARGSTASASR